MKVTITARKMQVPQSFPDYADKKLDSKLSKFFGEEADAKITMTEHKNQIILELTVKYNNMIFRAERTAEDKNDEMCIRDSYSTGAYGICNVLSCRFCC